jgi:hypothetical protein
VFALYNKSALGHKPPNKLNTYWRGPMKVVGREGSSVYELLDLVLRKTFKFHVSSLKEFKWDGQDPEYPRQVANKDYEAMDVKQIKRHQCSDGSKKSTYRFLVQFVDNEERWLPWKDLRTNMVLHDYLKKINKASWIPKSIVDGQSVIQEEEDDN